jgi:small subunit ribosomal protein S20
MAVKKKKPSVLKRQRQEPAKKARNRNLKTRVKSAVKKVRASILDSKPEYKQELARALREIDRSVSKGIFHKRTAARKKSRLMRMANKLATGIGEAKK